MMSVSSTFALRNEMSRWPVAEGQLRIPARKIGGVGLPRGQPRHWRDFVARVGGTDLQSTKYLVDDKRPWLRRNRAVR